MNFPDIPPTLEGISEDFKTFSKGSVGVKFEKEEG